MSKKSAGSFYVPISCLVILILTVLLFILCHDGTGRTGDGSPHEVPIDGEDAITLLEHGTGVLFLTWDECAWCGEYMKTVDGLSEKYGISVSVFDIHDDREDLTETYEEIKGLLSEELSENGCYDIDGKTKIYVPCIVFVSKGDITGFDCESSMLYAESESDIADYWNGLSEDGVTRAEALRERLDAYFSVICEKQEMIEKQGCGDRCSAS